mmetsp:Transcript_25455/g.37533  ORF Transcript_25455/g.37533 Transcript_25455/m.37533 type:complete len:1708 (-) Transcript_25455:115-5238(-)
MTSTTVQLAPRRSKHGVAAFIKSSDDSDLALLSEADELEIEYVLRRRYESDQIYTNAASILVVLNPFQHLDVCSVDLAERISSGESITEPHVFVFSENVCQCLLNGDPFSGKREKQAIIVSGISGSGKTNTAKDVLKYLTLASECVAERNGNHSALELPGRIRSAYRVLESFGNAYTHHNGNSSRHGKYTEITYSSQGYITSAHINIVLLEKSRVSSPLKGQRNFHVFHEVCAGLSSEERAALNIEDPLEFLYLNISDENSVDQQETDRENFTSLVLDLETLGMSVEDIADLSKYLLAILHIGNIQFEFTTTGEVQFSPASDRHISAACTTLIMDRDGLLEKITRRANALHCGRTVETTASLEECFVARDIMAQGLYVSLCDHILGRINDSLTISVETNLMPSRASVYPVSSVGDVLPSISLFDMYGFESCSRNSYMQMCANYTHEKLQRQFLHEFGAFTNSKCDELGIDIIAETVELYEHPRRGIFSLCNRALNTPNMTDCDLIESIYCKYETKKRLFIGSTEKKLKLMFGVRHTCGEVWYSAADFLRTEVDQTAVDVGIHLRTSNSSSIHKHDISDTDSVDNRGLRQTRSQFFQKTCFAYDYSNQLDRVLYNLGNTQCHYIRCIRPNNDMVPHEFDHSLVRTQMESLGIPQTVTLYRNTYMVRMAYGDFAERYKAVCAVFPHFHFKSWMKLYNIARATEKDNFWRQFVTVLLFECIPVVAGLLLADKPEYISQLNVVKMTPNEVCMLWSTAIGFEIIRRKSVDQLATVLQRHLRSRLTLLPDQCQFIALRSVIYHSFRWRRQHVEYEHSARLIQRIWKKYIAVMRRLRCIGAVLLIQSAFRGHRQRTFMKQNTGTTEYRNSEESVPFENEQVALGNGDIVKQLEFVAESSDDKQAVGLIPETCKSPGHQDRKIEQANSHELQAPHSIPLTDESSPIRDDHIESPVLMAYFNKIIELEEDKKDLIDQLRDTQERYLALLTVGEEKFLKVKRNGHVYSTTIWLSEDRRFLHWLPDRASHKSANDCVVDLACASYVQRGHTTPAFRNCRKLNGKPDAVRRSFSVIYSSRSVDLCATTDGAFETWFSVLSAAIEEFKCDVVLSMVRNQWEKLFLDGRKTLGFSELAALTRSMKVYVPEARILTALNRTARDDVLVDVVEVANLLKELMKRVEVECIWQMLVTKGRIEGKITTMNILNTFVDEDILSEELSLNVFADFWSRVQKRRLSESDAVEMVRILRHEPASSRPITGIQYQTFLNLITDDNNDSFMPFKQSQYQEMGHPITHYYIKCGPSTYHTPIRAVGPPAPPVQDGTTYRYIQDLRNGCRFIQLHCWNGEEKHGEDCRGHPVVAEYDSDGAPGIVTRFDRCLQMIIRIAFDSSPFPLILYIDNHCNSANQVRMVASLKNLGQVLVMPHECSSGNLPSPNVLKKRVMIALRDRPVTASISGSTCISKDGDEILRECAVFYYREATVGLRESIGNKFPGQRELVCLEHNAMIDLILSKDIHLVPHTQCLRFVFSNAKDDAIGPAFLWSTGAQAVDCDFPPDAREVVDGKFLENGNCGYVLKPRCILWDSVHGRAEGLSCSLHVISATNLHIPYSSSDLTNLQGENSYVEILIQGLPQDTQMLKTVSSGGFGRIDNPIWDEVFSFSVSALEFALVSFRVYLGGYLAGCSTVPLHCLQEGFRCVRLRNPGGSGEDIFSRLFIRASFE